MKRLYCRITLGLFINIFVAQAAFAQLKYGAKVGSSFTSFSKDNRNLSGNIGLIAGGFVDYEFTKPIFVQASIDYHQLRGSLQNSDIKQNDYLLVQTNNYTLHLAELTALAGYKIPVPYFGSASPYALIGGSAGYNFFTVNQRESTYYYSSYSLTSHSKADATAKFPSLLYSLQGGLRFNFPLEDSMFSGIFVDILYRRNVNPLNGGITLSNGQSSSSIYSNSLLLSLGFRL